MKKLESELISFLFENRDHFVTSQELADVLSVSDRTVRTYVNQMKNLLLENGAEISAKPGYGYQLVIHQPMLFDSFLAQSEIRVICDDRKGVEEAKDRQNYILNKLLLEDETLLLEELADELYVSRSTISKDFTEVRGLLKPYDLVIMSRPNKGVWIEGNEKNKRHFIMTYFFGKNLTNSFQKYMSNSPYFTEINLEEMAIIILDECRESKIKLSDFIIQNLVMHLALGIKRLQNGFTLESTMVDTSLVSANEREVAQRILERVSSISGVEFPPNEIDYLALHLMAKSNSSEQALTQNPPELEEELHQILKKMEVETGVPVAEDITLRNGLLDHIRPLLVRLKQKIHLENPLLKEIKTDYVTVFLWTKYYLGELSYFQGYDVSEDEWAYLTLHLMAAMEKYNDVKKLQALVICATGLGSAQLLKTRVIKEFGNYINVVDVRGYYEIDEQSLDNIDLIISSIDLSSIIFKVPVFYVSVFLNDNDVAKIRKALEFTPKGANAIYLPEQQVDKSKKEKEDLFDSQVRPEYFLRFSGTRTKNEVVNELLKTLAVDEPVTYVNQMKEQMTHREQMGSVIFGEAIAVPHPAMPVGTKTKVAIGIAEEGIWWDADFPNIKIVFLLSPSYLENKGIMPMTKAIVRLIDLSETQKKLIEEENFENFRETFISLM